MNANYEPHAFSRRSFLKGAGAVGAAGLLAACGSSSSTASGSTSGAASGSTATTGGLTEVYSYESNVREIESWNVLYSQNASDFNVLTNCVDGLLSADCYGKPVAAIAESWEHNEDASVWTFHLREDVDWCDVNGEVKGHITSKDFLVGSEWVLNQFKNSAFNTSMPLQTIAGAEEYYEYTVEQGDAAADLTYQDMLDHGVGIEAPDDYTLVFTCKNPCPYFDTVAGYVCFYPASEELINELGIEGFRAATYAEMWYCGPYLIEEFVQSNTKSFIPNPNWYGANDHSRFERVVVTMLTDMVTGYQLYQNRELDEIELTESTVTQIQNDSSNEFNHQLCERQPKKFSYQFHFNYQRFNDDGTPDDNWNKAIANTAFRKCFMQGLDLTRYYARTNPINPLKCENDYYTMRGVCYNTQGVEYTSLVGKKMGYGEYDGETMIRLRDNGGDISALKKQAMEELSAIGVTFPVHCWNYILSGNTSAQDSAAVMKQAFTDCFGDDFIVLDVGEYVSSVTKEVVNAHRHSYIQNGWGADFGDPINFLGQEILTDDNAYYSWNYSYIAKVFKEGPADWQADLIATYQEFERLVREADAIVDDIDARYEAFATAEAYMLENCLTMPAQYEVLLCLTHVNDYSKINAMYGICNYKYVDWETSEEAYTTEQYEELAAAYEAAMKA
ncbi:ABC transporter substrate-binding protein [Faecalibacterium sp. An192]|uniref:peptide ABC transporter substrate-binding protein n=1 Tax=Faecalibacterium sp. An192 TaxID=1965581 RepID=UPI000B36F3E3|nr:ABC transporter substrate-binding protein [Faecalibacterium sp. An192]OUP27991.1 Tat pathway signal sequence [Faecalibacterium sp. An192]